MVPATLNQFIPLKRQLHRVTQTKNLPLMPSQYKKIYILQDAYKTATCVYDRALMINHLHTEFIFTYIPRKSQQRKYSKMSNLYDCPG